MVRRAHAPRPDRPGHPRSPGVGRTREHDAVTLPAYTGSLTLDYAEVAQR